MSEEFEKLLNEEEGHLTQIRTGAIVKGTVIGVKENEISLNIGYKADGILTRQEYTNDSSLDLTTVVKVGDEMEVKVLKLNDGDGQVILSYKRLAQDRGKKRLEEAKESGEILTAKVVQVQSAGLSVMIEGIRVFIPASMVSDGFERDLTKYADQEIEFRMAEVDPRKHRFIGDRKSVLVERKAVLKKELFARIEEGMIVEGTVKNLTDFGAFIDLGGADGLLHISEMSWGRIESPKKVFKVGDHVEAFIEEIKGEKIALSMKFPDRNPWLNAEEKYAAGKVVKGRVARMVDFGAFIELEPGVDALLHVSQISRDHVDKPSDVLSVGQEIEAKVVEFNAEDKKISLSIKQLEMDREQENAGEAEAVKEAAEAVEETAAEE